ncbi:MAG: hypothetical protein M1510_07900 [Nitrospirae bacterium]|nr:hypothetical protein [Nitrospirota bacterium]MCL5237898.1 hypothetical protein [Nitrospirota bacterium]
MPKFIKRILIVWLVFVILAVVGGGSQFRIVNDKAGWLTKAVFDALASKADDLKEDADFLIGIIKDLAGKKKELAKNTL